MPSTSSAILVLAIATFAFAEISAGARCKGTARYRVTFNYRWTSKYFTNVPASAHFSPLVALSHESRFSSFSRFGYATPGVESVAETGATSLIRDELSTAKENGQVKSFSTDNRIPGGGGSASVEVIATCRHRHISAISMVAPSPDWIVALFRRRVVRKNAFVEKLTGSLRVYDAGTDSGETFSARNKDTSPKQNIAPLEGSPFNGKVIARYTIRKL